LFSAESRLLIVSEFGCKLIADALLNTRRNRHKFAPRDNCLNRLERGERSWFNWLRLTHSL
jgi:hypothetical protein